MPALMKNTTRLLALAFSLPSLFCAAQGTTATSNNPSTRADRAAAEADFQSALKDPKRIVTLGFREPDYSKLATNFTEADLPAFFEVLNDEDSPFMHKDKALELIACLTITNRDAAVDRLVDFMKRPVHWDKQTADTRWAVENVLAKSRAVMAICKVGGDKSQAVLKRIITSEGAREVAKDWISGWPSDNPYGSQQEVLGELRGAAAYELARNQANWELVQTEYARERQACIESGKRSHYISGLISGMALIDTIKEVGTLPDPRVPSLLMKNVNKYELPAATPKALGGPASQ
jgi:hypothetical protein